MVSKKKSFEEQTRRDIGDLKGSMKELSQSVNLVAVQVAQNTTDIQILKTDVRELKTDVQGLKTDVQGLKEDTSSIRTSMVVVEKQMGDLLTIMREGYAPKSAQHQAQLDDHENRIQALEKT